MPSTPRTPILTPEQQQNDVPIFTATPQTNTSSSQYSSGYNDHWNRLMNEPNLIHNPGEISDDDFIQGRALTLDDLNGEEDSNSSTIGDFDGLGFTPEASNSTTNIVKDWGEGVMPATPDYPKQIIDIDSNGYDPMMMENINVKKHLDEDKKENIAILYNGKTYLTSRDIINQQEVDATIYECLEGDKKTFKNIIGNLPLYNIKKIGIDISSDNAVGIEPEYIYMDGIDELLEDKDDWQYYSIIPLPNKQLVSVISLSEASKVGTDNGSGVSALHCQAGQGGLAGIIVKAYPNNVSGGTKRHHNMKTMKGGKKGKGKGKRKTLKKKRNKQIGSSSTRKRKTVYRNKKSKSKSHSKKH